LYQRGWASCWENIQERNAETIASIDISIQRVQSDKPRDAIRRIADARKQIEDYLRFAESVRQLILKMDQYIVDFATDPSPSVDLAIQNLKLRVELDALKESHGTKAPQTLIDDNRRLGELIASLETRARQQVAKIEELEEQVLLKQAGKALDSLGSVRKMPNRE